MLFPGRPVDLALIDEGRTLIIKNMKDLLFVDATTVTVAVQPVVSLISRASSSPPPEPSICTSSASSVSLRVTTRR